PATAAAVAPTEFAAAPLAIAIRAILLRSRRGIQLIARRRPLIVFIRHSVIRCRDRLRRGRRRWLRRRRLMRLRRLHRRTLLRAGLLIETLLILRLTIAASATTASAATSPPPSATLTAIVLRWPDLALTAMALV